MPVHADIPAIDAMFLAELDDKSNPLKSKGIGELGICGAGAAVANAVYNACGVRVRDYPVTLDKLLGAWGESVPDATKFNSARPVCRLSLRQPLWRPDSCCTSNRRTRAGLHHGRRTPTMRDVKH